MEAERAKLPAAQARAAIIASVRAEQVRFSTSRLPILRLLAPNTESNVYSMLQVVLISGQTGCGKTTQVPQVRTPVPSAPLCYCYLLRDSPVHSG